MLPRALLIGLVVIAAGCVLKSEHDMTVAENVRISSELQSTTKERNELKDKVEDTQKKNSELEARNEELSNTNQMLVGKGSDSARRCQEAQQELLALKQEKAKSEEKIAFATKTYDDLIASLKDEIAKGQVAIANRGDRLSVNVADQVLFPSGSDRIQASGEKVLKKVSEILRSVKDKRIEVEGHTDNVRITGSLTAKFPSNWELSTARATKVVRFLEKNGVDPDRLAAVGYAEHRPVAANNTPEGRKKNRRIEIVLLPLPKST